MLRDELADDARQPRPLPVGADHNLQGTVAVHAAKVEVALGGDVGDVGGDAPLLAQFPNHGRRGRVVDGHQHHVGAIEVRGDKVAVDVGNLLLGDPVRYLRVEASGRGNDRYVSVGIEAVEDTACGDL